MNTLRLLDSAFRLCVLTISMVALTFFVFTFKAHAAEPKTLAVVSGDTLKAGDVFDGLNQDQAEYMLGTPPLPGKDMVLDAHILTRIADTIGLNWQPKSPAMKTTVRRAATIVNDTDIRTALDKSLREEGVDGKFNVLFSEAEAPQIVLPAEMPQSVAIKTIRFDATHETFEAILVAPSTDRPIKQLAVLGKVQRLTSVPVLKTTMRRGDSIGASDIQMTDVPNDEIQNGMVLKAENLAGMTPQRVIDAGKPVLDSDIQRPQVMGRGDFITLVYANGPLTLTAKGKAMQDGARGDLVRVLNISSSRALQGVASGDHEVTISQ